MKSSITKACSKLCVILQIMTLVFILAPLAYPAAPIPTSTPTPGGIGSILDHVITSGSVYSITVTANDIYIGGNFYALGRRTGYGVVLDPVTGNLLPGFPEIASNVDSYVDGVYEVVSDNNGGWYVGGYFSHAAGIQMSNLIHIFSNGSIDTSFNMTVDYVINALAFDGTNLYVACATYTLDQCIRKIDGVTGNSISSFNGCFVDGGIFSMAVNGTSLYVGGSFLHAGSYQSRPYIAKLDTVTGMVDPGFNAMTNGLVNVIYFDSGQLYAGGGFSSIGGAARNNVARLDPITGNADPLFNPNANSAVYDIAVDGPDVYLAGNFTSVGGIVRNRAAKTDLNGNLDLLFDPNAGNNTIHEVEVDPLTKSIYLGGQFMQINGQSIRNLAKVESISGTADVLFRPDPMAGVYALCFDGSKLFVGGQFPGINAYTRQNIAKISSATGQVDPLFAPVVDDYVYSIGINGNNAYIGGFFRNVNGQQRRGVAKLDAVNGTLDAFFDPDCGINREVTAIAFGNSSVYLGGNFVSLHAMGVSYAAKVDEITGIPDLTFAPYVLGQVRAICPAGNELIIGGNFMTVGGQSALRMARIDSLTGALNTGFAANPDSFVYSMAYDGVSVFVAGYFNNINGVPSRYLGKVDALTGNVDPLFHPQVNGEGYAVACDGPGVFAGGLMMTMGMVNRNYIGEVSSATGIVDVNFAPQANKIVRALALSPANDVLYVGGGFNMINRMPVVGYAALYLGPLPTATYTSSETYTITQTRTVTLTVTVTLTKTLTQTRTETSTLTITETQTITMTATETPDVTPTVSPTYTPVSANFASDVVIFPNPSDGHYTFAVKNPSGAQKLEVSIYTVNLRLIRKFIIETDGTGLYPVYLDNVNNGIYIARIRLLKDGVEVFRLVRLLDVIR